MPSKRFWRLATELKCWNVHSMEEHRKYVDHKIFSLIFFRYLNGIVNTDFLAHCAMKRILIQDTTFWYWQQSNWTNCMTCRFIDHFTMKIFQISPAQHHDTLNLSDNSQKTLIGEINMIKTRGYHIFGMYFSASVPLL